MKTHLFLTAGVFIPALLSSVAFSQGATGPAQSAPESAVVAGLPAPDQIVYVPRLPTAVELTKVATAQGFAVEKIVQTAGQITVVYQISSGQTNTVAYQLLPASGAAAVAAAPSAPAVTVVYETPAPVYYYDPWPWSYPWYGPVGIRFGFGFRGGYYHPHRW